MSALHLKVKPHLETSGNIFLMCVAGTAPTVSAVLGFESPSAESWFFSFRQCNLPVSVRSQGTVPGQFVEECTLSAHEPSDDWKLGDVS